MSLPIMVFWFMNNTIPRVMAEENLRSLTVANAAQSREGAENARRTLIVEMGEVMKHDPVAEPLDRRGLHALKGLATCR